MREFFSFIVGTIVGWVMPPILVHVFYVLIIAAVATYKFVGCS